MAVKKIIFTHENRTFRAEIRPSWRDMGCVYFYELKPNAKIWKWRYRDSFDFWVTDYDTIEQGVRDKFAKMMGEEAHRIAIAKKWSEFDAQY